jgi:aldose sugar dehydrogenase
MAAFVLRRAGIAIVLLSIGLIAGFFGSTSGKIDATKIRNFLQYNPLLTSRGEVHATSSIETNQITLDVESYSLPALASGFESGGGAIIERDDGIIILTRTGKMFAFAKEAVSELPFPLDNNNATYEAYARSQGYFPGPGTNLGYAGLGMRNHDMLLLGDGSLLASQTYWKAEEHCAVLRVMRLDAKGWSSVAETAPCIPISDKKGKPFAGHQAGGRMLEMAAGQILLTTGDFKHDGSRLPAIAEGSGVHYGKTLLIDVQTGRIQIHSSGHRNAQGLTRDDAGNIWSTEHGPVGGDELNLIRQGADYGWPRATLGRDCQDCEWQQNGRQSGFEQSVHAWVPSIGISNLIQLHDFAPAWDGDLVVASLKNESLHRLRLENGNVQFDEPIVIGDRIRDIIQLRDHRIALLTDSGHLIFIKRKLEATPSEIALAAFSPDVKVAVAECKSCHTFDSGRPLASAIRLWGIVGSSRAGTPYPAYSAALKRVGGQWTEPNLDVFLRDPQAAIPGTSMAYAGVKDDETRKGLIKYLGTLR